MKNINKPMALAATIIFSLNISACNDSDKSKENKNPEEQENIITIDASSSEDFVYYNLETLQAVEVSDPQNSSDWHIGFKRTSIILNGGDAGPGSVAGALAAENNDFYLEDEPVLATFINAEPSNQLTQFEAAAFGEEITEYIEDENALAIDGNSISAFGPVTHWYNYDFNPITITGTHAITVNDTNYWIIRSAAGNSYAQFRVTDIIMVSEGPSAGRAIEEMDIELAIQGSGDESFDESFSETLTFSGSDPICYDIDTEAEASCEENTWDLFIDPALEIYVNSGIEGGGSGAAFGSLAAEDLSSFASGTSVPHWISDSTSSIFSEETWYAYNLEGAHKLWSNYNVYAIDTNTEDENSLKIKAQILSYYSEEGDSGHFSIRIDEL